MRTAEDEQRGSGGDLVILWEPTPGLGIPDGFSLYILHSSNVFKIFHTSIPLGDCAKGGRAEGAVSSQAFPPQRGKADFVFGTERHSAPMVGAFPGERFFLTSLAKCHLCMMVYRAVPSCWEVVQCWNLVISLMLGAWCWTVGANLHSTINLTDSSVPLWWRTKPVGYIHLSLKKEMVFQPERAMFHFMVLFYLVISVEDIYLKENRERQIPPFGPTLLNFISCCLFSSHKP